MDKIAVPSRDGMVDQHFGHCAYFTVFTIGEDRSVMAENQFAPPPSCGCKSNLVGTLVEMGVSTLIAGNMGEGAVVKLQGSGIKVVRGASGPVRRVVENFLAGRLMDSRTLCTEHGHQCLHDLGGHGGNN